MTDFDHLVILILLAVAILVAQTIIVVMLVKMRTAQSALIARETQRAIPHALREITREWAAWAKANSASIDQLEIIQRGIANKNFGLTCIVAFLEKQGFKLDDYRL